MKGGEVMKRSIRRIISVFLLLAFVFAAGVEKSDASLFGHRSGKDLKLISSLELSAQEQASLKSALVTYGPAVKAAWQNFRAAKKQLDADLKATTPAGSQLAADAVALQEAKSQLKTALPQLNNALLAALTPAHLQQIQGQLTAPFQKKLDARTGRLLFKYTRNLEKE
jgi:hypothetical protein